MHLRSPRQCPFTISVEAGQMKRSWQRRRQACRDIIVGVLSCILASCGEPEGRPPDIKRLATDVHVTIGDQPLVLPFIALEHYAYRGLSFSLDPAGDAERATDAASALMRNGSDPNSPVQFDRLTVVIKAYGFNDTEMRPVKMCASLTAEWSRSVCDDPWAALAQALPYNRFEFVDLSKKMRDTQNVAPCVRWEVDFASVSRAAGHPMIICGTTIGGTSGRFYRAAVRIEGNLGAYWTVWDSEGGGERAETMAAREGRAIVAFADHLLSGGRDFTALNATMCGLRRPGSRDAPRGPDHAPSPLPPGACTKP